MAHDQYPVDGGQLGLEAMRRLRLRSVCDIDDGLTDAEFARVEREFGFEFADDHRAFLAAGLPVNTRPRRREPGVLHTHPDPWPDWRNGDPAALQEILDWPVQGVLFDVEMNGFWHAGWGPRPDDPRSATETARRMLLAVPRMIPVYGHRFLPAGRWTSHHPVLSMWQTDIVFYGLNLADYIDHEFGGADSREGADPGEPKATVEFWRDFV